MYWLQSNTLISIKPDFHEATCFNEAHLFDETDRQRYEHVLNAI